MTTRTEKYQALPQVAKVGVIVVLAILGVWLYVSMSDFGNDPAVAGCDQYAELVDDVNDGGLGSTSDEVVDRLDRIGETMAEGDGEVGDAGAFLTSQADVARTFPDDRDSTVAGMVERAGQVC